MRLIDADAMIEDTLKDPIGIQLAERYNLVGYIEGRPTIEERKTGKWQITEAYPHNVYCSECHKRFAQTHWAVWEDGSLPRSYCPNCGARMEAKDVV